MAQADFIVSLAQVLGEILQPIANIDTAEGLTIFMSGFGWVLEVDDATAKEVATALSIVDDAKTLVEFLTSAEEGLPSPMAALAAVEQVKKAIESLPQLAPGTYPTIYPFSEAWFWSEFAGELMQYLVYEYLKGGYATLFGVLSACGVVCKTAVPADPATRRFSHETRIVNWNQLGSLLTNAAQCLQTLYSSALGEPASALQNLTDLATGMGAQTQLLLVPDEILGLYFDPSSLLRSKVRALDVNFIRYYDSAANTTVSADLLVLPVAKNDDPVSPFRGLTVIPYLTGGAEPTFTPIPGITIAIEGKFSSSGMLRLDLLPEGVALIGDPGAAEANFGATVTWQPDDGPLFLLGSERGTHLSVAGAKLALRAGRKSNQSDIAVEIDLLDAEFVVSAGDGDGFLQQILPADPLSLAFSVGFGISSTRGFYFKTDVALRFETQVALSVGPLSIDTLGIALEPVDSGIDVDLTVSGAAAIGPVTVTFDRIGLSAGIAFNKPGLLGNADLDFGFKGPSSLGLSIDAGPVTGGGLLSFDEASGRYCGAIQLQLADIALNAVGLLDTKDAAGNPLGGGYSLLVIICGQFPPVQIGFGFSLNAVGGLVGLNRTMAADSLRSGVTSGALDSLMFPNNPSGNSAQLVASLEMDFPVAKDHFLVAPMVRLGWGASILTLDLCVLLDISNSVRTALVGCARLALPDPDHAVVLFNLDCFGVFQPDTGDISLDASLFESKIADFPVTGDMALRANWKDKPYFIFSAGGFHPAFTAPADFPKLQRLAITISKDDDPRIRMESYFALTSNTVQFGAAAELYASAGPFSILGTMSFDALISLNPFGLQVDLRGSVDVQAWGDSICSVFLAAHLTGPHPWHAWGKVKFSVLFVSGEVHFDAQIGSAPSSPEALPPAVDVSAKLLSEIKQTANWAALPPSGLTLLVMRALTPQEKIAAATNSQLMAHPLGGLKFHQRVVPLDVNLQRFGIRPIAGATEFHIDASSVAIGSRSIAESLLTTQAVTDAFAPAQFFDLSDDEKLSRPSFEDFGSGISIDFEGVDFDDLKPSDAANPSWELESPDDDATSPVPATKTKFKMSSAHITRSVAMSPAGRTPARQSGIGRFAGPTLGIQTQRRMYAVIDQDSVRLPGSDGSVLFPNFTRAAQHRASVADPVFAPRLRVIATTEDT